MQHTLCASWDLHVDYENHVYWLRSARAQLEGAWRRRQHCNVICGLFAGKHFNSDKLPHWRTSRLLYFVAKVCSTAHIKAVAVRPRPRVGSALFVCLRELMWRWF